MVSSAFGRNLPKDKLYKLKRRRETGVLFDKLPKIVKSCSFGGNPVNLRTKLMPEAVERSAVAITESCEEVSHPEALISSPDRSYR